MKLFELLLLFDNAQNTYSHYGKHNAWFSVSSQFIIHSVLLIYVPILTRNQPKYIFLPIFFETDCKTPGENTGGKNSHWSSMRNISSYTYVHTHTLLHIFSCKFYSNLKHSLKQESLYGKQHLCVPRLERHACVQGPVRGTVLQVPFCTETMQTEA